MRNKILKSVKDILGNGKLCSHSNPLSNFYQVSQTIYFILALKNIKKQVIACMGIFPCNKLTNYLPE